VEQESDQRTTTVELERALNKLGGVSMTNEKVTLSVRSVSAVTKARMADLAGYTRLTYGSLIDDAVEALWAEYEADGHVLPDIDIATDKLE
jgi:hypothetical protein